MVRQDIPINANFCIIEIIPSASEQESTLNVYGILGFIKLWAGNAKYIGLTEEVF